MKEGNNKGAWAAAFSIGATAFASHAGGGFATGNQANNYFVSLGWISIFSAILAMVLLAFSVREGQIMWNQRGLKSYKELFANLFHPYDKISIVFDVFYDIMILMVVASCIAGAASALNQYLGINYHVGAIAGTLIILLLSIFGTELIRKVNSYMGTCILVLAISIYLIGIIKSDNLMPAMSAAFEAQGMENLPKAVINAFTYAGFQWVTIPAVLACGTILKNKSECTKGMILTMIFNILGLGLSVLMLFSWSSYYTTVENGTTVPTLTVLMNPEMGMGFLVVLYVITLFLCLISSGVAVVFGFINRFENAAFLSKIENTQARRTLIALFIICVSMFISFAGLTNVVKYGYGYCGYIGIFVAVIPLLTVGYYKNRKWIKEHGDKNAE